MTKQREAVVEVKVDVSQVEEMHKALLGLMYEYGRYTCTGSPNPDEDLGISRGALERVRLAFERGRRR